MKELTNIECDEVSGGFYDMGIGLGIGAVAIGCLAVCVVGFNAIAAGVVGVGAVGVVGAVSVIGAAGIAVAGAIAAGAVVVGVTAAALYTGVVVGRTGLMTIAALTGIAYSSAKSDTANPEVAS
ncbi:hypothetical protein ACMGGR_17540 [Erwinia sp. BNK-24-b]|uniref:hypothetical protein n=1 Tax=unclassified Erwinia TaxID=2622719 RepID=UPI0039BF8C9F